VIVPGTWAALRAVWHERERQELKCAAMRDEGLNWRTCADPAMPDLDKLAVLAEEFGDVARELCEAIATGAAPDPNLRRELVQVAAVAVAWIEALS
jgi:hypothetical protein